MWLASLAGGFGVPLAGYGAGILTLVQHRKESMADDPELASELTVPTPWDWLASRGGMIGHAMFVLVTAGVVLLMLLVLLQLARFVMDRTKLSGVDEEERERERRDFEDDLSADADGRAGVDGGSGPFPEPPSDGDES